MIPSLCIYMPNYNHSKYLPTTITSLLCQSYQNFELMIVDDCSTDDSLYVIRRFAELDPRLRVYRTNRNIGKYAIGNLCAKITKAPYFSYHGVDDISRSDRLAKQMKMLKENPDIDFLGTDFFYWDRKKPHWIRNRDIHQIMPAANCFAHSTVIMKRDAFLRVGGYRGDSDYVLWFSLLLGGYKGANLMERLLTLHSGTPTNHRKYESYFKMLEPRVAKMSEYSKDRAAKVVKRVRDMPGYIFDSEVADLYRLAFSSVGDGAIVEIGAAQGKSTTALALGCIDGGTGKVLTIDSYAQKTIGSIEVSEQLFRKNTAWLQDIIDLRVAKSEQIGKQWNRPIKMLFIDADHSYEGVKKDIALFLPHVIPGGVVAFHDYANSNYPGVAQAVDDIKEKLFFRTRSYGRGMLYAYFR